MARLLKIELQLRAPKSRNALAIGLLEALSGPFRELMARVPGRSRSLTHEAIQAARPLWTATTY